MSYNSKAKYSIDERLEKMDELSKTYHFIYMDIVAFSDPQIHATEQIEKIKQLNKIVSSSKTFSDSDRIALPTGDGMVIGFGESCEQPFYLALEVSTALNEYNKDKEDKHKIKLRTGLHMGAVFTAKDINGRKNVWGPGINIARRVMDEGRVGHILATDVKELKQLKPEIDTMIKEVGRREIKHGEILKIYNIHDEKEGIGNPSAPFADMHAKTKIIIDSSPRGYPFSISRICPDCRANIPRDSKFCNKCGYKL